MKHNWEYKVFGDLCNIVRGGSPRPIQEYLTDSPDGLNWIKIGDVAAGSKYITSTKEKIKPSGLKKTRQVKSGDFILSNSMSFGRPYILKIDGCIHDGWLAIQGVNRHFIPDFLFYYLSSPSTYATFAKLANCGVVSNLNSDIVKGISVPVPPMEVQERIVAELDDINAMIEGKHEQLKQLDLLAQSVFYTMFGDPVTNPKGWEESKLIDCIADGCSISYGIVQPGDDFPDGVPVVRPIDLIGGKYVKRDNLKTVDPAISDTYKRTILLGNEILMCVRGTTGVIRMADISLKDANVTRGITPLRIKNSINVTYMFEYLKQQKAQEFIKYYTKGTTLKQINMADLRNLPVNLPPADLQEKFAAKIEAIEAQKADIEATIKELQTLLDSRMDYWFN